MKEIILEPKGMPLDELDKGFIGCIIVRVTKKSDIDVLKVSKYSGIGISWQADKYKWTELIARLGNSSEEGTYKELIRRDLEAGWKVLIFDNEYEFFEWGYHHYRKLNKEEQ